MDQNQFSISRRMKSFKHAFNGLRVLFGEEPNARIHLFAAIIAVIAGYSLGISSYEWISITFAIGLVISLEIINTSIENLADFVTLEKHSQIKKVKDLGAASVLLGACTALIIGLMIFLPKIIAVLFR